MALQLVAARSLNNVIGNGSEIPWNVHGEQSLFKEITMNGVLLMGRKTYESIGRRLPGRITIIITRNRQYHQPGCEIATSLAAAINYASRQDRPVFAIGGGEIYAQALPVASGVHLTTIQQEVEGDIFFPVFPTVDFTLVEEKFFKSNIDYLYQHYKRR